MARAAATLGLHGGAGAGGPADTGVRAALPMATASRRAWPMDYKSRFSAVFCRGEEGLGEPWGSQGLFCCDDGEASGTIGLFYGAETRREGALPPGGQPTTSIKCSAYAASTARFTDPFGGVPLLLALVLVSRAAVSRRTSVASPNKYSHPLDAMGAG